MRNILSVFLLLFPLGLFAQDETITMSRFVVGCCEGALSYSSTPVQNIAADTEDMVVVDFWITKEYETMLSTAIYSLKCDDGEVKLTVTDGLLTIEGTPQSLHIYNNSGAEVYCGKTSQVRLARGFYVVSVKGRNEKLIVR